jgi:hypothetical protein
MKKKSTVFCLLILAALLKPGVSHSLDVRVGAATWYAWWNPVFEDFFRGKLNSSVNNLYIKSSFSTRPSFLLGPYLSMGFLGKWSLSSSFLIGNWYDSSVESYTTSSPYTTVRYERTDVSIRKWDLDALLSYSFTPFFKVFAGFKWQGYIQNLLGMNSDVGSGVVEAMRLRYSNIGLGPGIGLGVTIPLGGGFYCIGNASFIYLYVRMRLGIPMDYGEVYNAFGGSASLSLSYCLASASTTISLGFRYQVLHYLFWGGATDDYFINDKLQPERVSRIYRGQDDHFYGITLAAVYAFDFD